jgi:hypothetical protein
MHLTTQSFLPAIISILAKKQGGLHEDVLRKKKTMWTVTNKHCHGYKKTDLHVGCFSYIVIVSNVLPISKRPIQPTTIHHEIARDERNLECPTLEFCGSISTSLLRRVVRDSGIMQYGRGVSKLKCRSWQTTDHTNLIDIGLLPWNVDWSYVKLFIPNIGFHYHDHVNIWKLILYEYMFIVCVFISKYPSKEICTICKYIYICVCYWNSSKYFMYTNCTYICYMMLYGYFELFWCKSNNSCIYSYQKYAYLNIQYACVCT